MPENFARGSRSSRTVQRDMLPPNFYETIANDTNSVEEGSDASGILALFASLAVSIRPFRRE